MKRIINTITLMLLSLSAYSQTTEESQKVEIFFDRGSYAIEQSIHNNGESISQLTSLINEIKSDSLSTIIKVQIDSYTSPEGGRRINKELSQNRSKAIFDFATTELSLPAEIIHQNNVGTDWESLAKLVSESDISDKEEVLDIIKNVPEETWRRVKPNDRWLTLTDSRNKHLMDLNLGRPYNYMDANIFPKLRRGAIVTIYFKKVVPPVAEEKVAKVEKETTPPVEEPTIVPTITPVTAPAAPKPLFALKTNLLFDAATLLNVELEVPIGDRWSVAGEFIFPWWTSCGNKNNGWQSNKSSSRNTLEILNGNIEAKYWLGDRSKHEVMTGWHVGLYAGGGEYDLERKAEGYQGTFFLAAGLSGGYAHTINKSGSLRMEYSLGVGYLKTDYHHYKEHYGIDDEWHPIRQKSGNYTWIGPTRARISLVWMLNKK